MSTIHRDTASPGLTTSEAGASRRRGRRIFFIVLFVFAVAGAGYFLKRQQDRAQWKRALGLLPQALSEVPLPNESPEIRFRKACALLAKRMDVSAADVEAGVRSMAWEIKKSDHPAASDSERQGASLAFCYLHDPENPKTLNDRENLAACLAQDNARPEAEMELRALIIYRRALEGKDTLDLARHHSNLSGNLWFQKRYPEAEAEARETLSMRERLAGPDDEDTVVSRSFLAFTLHAQRKYTEEETLRRAVLAVAEQRKPAEPDPEIKKKIMSYSKPSAAFKANLEKEAKNSAANAQKHQDWYLAKRRYDLADCLYEQSKDDEAAPLADAALREFKAQEDWRNMKKAEDLQKGIKERKAKNAAP